MKKVKMGIKFESKNRYLENEKKEFQKDNQNPYKNRAPEEVEDERK